MHVCVYIYIIIYNIYIQNKYTQYTHIYYVNKNFILDAINRLIAQIFTVLFIK